MNDELLNGSVFKSLMLFAIPSCYQTYYKYYTELLIYLWWGISATTSDVSAVSIGSQTMAMLTNLILGLQQDHIL
ncbi:MAG: hypothetical protein ACLRQF_00300 [Thomasclavelia ramosa]